MNKKEFKYLGFLCNQIEHVTIINITLLTSLDLSIEKGQTTLQPKYKTELEKILKRVCSFLNLNGPQFFQEMIFIQDGEEFLLRNASNGDPDLIYIYQNYRTGGFQTMINSFCANYNITIML